MDVSRNDCTGIQIKSNSSKTIIISAYIRPSVTSITEYLNNISTSLKTQDVIIAMDCNAKNPLWNSTTKDKKGSEVEDFLLKHNLTILNTTKTEFCFIPRDTSFVDVTAKRDNIEVSNWKFLSVVSSSDHPYVYGQKRSKKSTGLLR